MDFADIEQRLQAAGALPETVIKLLALVEHDDATGSRNFGMIIPALYPLLAQADSHDVRPFALAWGTLNAALRRLDHLQDEDPDDDGEMAPRKHGSQYNLLFTYYLLANALLDELDPSIFPFRRIYRLRRLWSDCLLRVASGQQYDLEVTDTGGDVSTLDRYQEIVQAKTGALFALAFGGTATLATDDDMALRILSHVGEIYGVLIQSADDILDASTQTISLITLPSAYAAFSNLINAPQQMIDIELFWKSLYAIYKQQTAHVLSHLSPRIQQGVLEIFEITFEKSPTKETLT